LSIEGEILEGGNMERRAFTLIEVIIVVVIIGIFATFGYPLYRNLIENSKARVCEANLNALKAALDLYAMEHDVMPGDLSELAPRHIKKAYAKILKQKGSWRLRVADFILDFNKRGLAYAQNTGLMSALSRGNINLITCPADASGPLAGGISYGLWGGLRGLSYQAYQALSANSLLIGDCESNGFNSAADLAPRHRHFWVPTEHYTGAYAHGITVGDEIVKPGREDYPGDRSPGRRRPGRRPDENNGLETNGESTEGR